jgi:hypothetical protein
MKRWPVVCLFACAVSAAVAADASLSELAPPGTKVTIGVNVRKLLDSPLASEIGGADRDAATKMAMKGNLPGLDPFKDIDQVWVLLNSTSDKAPALIVVRGRFDVEQLGRGAKRYKGIPVVEGGAGAGGAIGLINGQTLIAGEMARVLAAIDGLGSEHLAAELQERIAAAGARFDIWSIGEVAEEPPATGKAEPAGAPSLGSIDRFMIGLGLQQGLALTAEVHARSTEDAAKLTAALSVLEAGLKAQSRDAGATIDVQQENGTFRISVAVPEAAVRKAIVDQKTAMVAALSGLASGGKPEAPSTAPAAAVPPPPPPPPPAPVAITPQAPSVTAPPAVRKLAARTQVVKAPNGDTMILKLPGAK